MSDDLDSPLTKRGLQSALRDMERDLKAFILEREVVTVRWVIGIQITYFFGTLAAVWFMLTHLSK